MAAKKVWYVEAVDVHTNGVVAGEVSAENAHRQVLCLDGVKRDLWECEYRFVAQMIKNEASAQLSFKVFYREGKYGPVRLWPFTKKRKPTLEHSLRKGLIQKGSL